MRAVVGQNGHLRLSELAPRSLVVFPNFGPNLSNKDEMSINNVLFLEFAACLALPVLLHSFTLPAVLL